MQIDSLLMQFSNHSRRRAGSADPRCAARRRRAARRPLRIDQRHMAEKLEALPPGVDFPAMINARNRIAHQYPANSAKQAEIINQVAAAVPVALSATTRRWRCMPGDNWRPPDDTVRTASPNPARASGPRRGSCPSAKPAGSARRAGRRSRAAVDQVARVGLRQRVELVAEDGEVRRAGLHLRHVADLDAPAGDGGRRHALDDAAPSQRFSLRGRDAPVPHLVRPHHGLHQRVDALAGQAGERHHAARRAPAAAGGRPLPAVPSAGPAGRRRGPTC